MEGEINTPPIAEPLCSCFTLAGLCLDLISCPGGSNRAALPGPTLHPRELRFLSHHNNSLSICWSGAPNFVVLTAAGLTPDFLHSCPPSSPLEGMIAFTAEVDGRGGLYLPSAHPPPTALTRFSPLWNFISVVLLCIGTVCLTFSVCLCWALCQAPPSLDQYCSLVQVLL